MACSSSASRLVWSLEIDTTSGRASESRIQKLGASYRKSLISLQLIALTGILLPPEVVGVLFTWSEWVAIFCFDGRIERTASAIRSSMAAGKVRSRRERRSHVYRLERVRISEPPSFNRKSQMFFRPIPASHSYICIRSSTNPPAPAGESAFPG